MSSIKQEAGTVVMNCCGQKLHLHPLKAIYWEEEESLLLADLHLGKATHFRKAGIAVPNAVSDHNFDQIINLLLSYQPKRLIILGDLFHSDYNRIWEEFADLVQQFAHISFELVPGNHDILEAQHYQKARIKLQPIDYQMGPFLLCHHPKPNYQGPLYVLAGHIHPGVRLYGKGRQSLKLPCFYFGAFGGILPAFGAFTGTAALQVLPSDRVYAITDTEVVELAY